MRWRQVAALWVVAMALGAEYWFVERPRAAAPVEDRTARPRLFTREPKAVEEVYIRRGGREIVVRRGTDGWSVVEPPDANVPADLLTAFLAALLEAEEIDRLTPTTPDLATYGLDERASRIELRGGTDAVDVVFIGSTNPTGTAVYARRGASSDIVLVGRTIQYYEELILQALPTPTVPADIGPIGLRVPLTLRAGAV